MLMSLAGIVFGVAFFIVTQAQTSGFERFFIRSIWGTKGAIRVQDGFQPTVTSMLVQAGDQPAGFEIPLREGRQYVPGVSNERSVIEAIHRFSEVIAVSGALRGTVVVRSGFRSENVEVLGVRMLDHIAVSDLAGQIRFGDISRFDDDPQSVLVGTILANRLGLDIGSSLVLEHVGNARRYTVAALFETGIEEYDKRQVFIPLREARLLLNRNEGLSFIQVQLIDNNRADIVARQMEEALQHNVNSWQRSEKTWLEVFRALRASSAITMSVIILIAGLGMFNTLAIIVMERSREIAILRSMGYSRRDVRRIFLYQGWIVLAVGTVLGWLFAVLLTLIISRIPIRIRGIFSTDHFVVDWNVWHYVSGAIVAAIVVTLASWFPARRAAAIEPAAIIRGSGA
jgi:lipoprotein-releasing system permease protein